MFVQKNILKEFRQVLKTLHCDAFLIPQGDQWSRETPEPSQNRFTYLSGLDASAGMVIITHDKAAVMIDNRYEEEAKHCIDQTLFEIGNYITTPPEDWLIQNMQSGSVIGYDPWLHSYKDIKRIKKACDDSGLILNPFEHNPLDIIWHDRPPALNYTAISHPLKYSGRSVDEKLSQVADQISADTLIISAADSLAWLLNLRTTENPHLPGIRGFAVFDIKNNQLNIFTDVDYAAFDCTQANIHTITFSPLNDFKTALEALSSQSIHISETAPAALVNQFDANDKGITIASDPCENLKAIKNETEKACIRASQLRDSKAVQRVIDWIKATNNITEQDVGDRLREERSQFSQFRGESFDTIAGWNANGASIHRRITPENNTRIEGKGFLLLDSGAQYDDGTTDITRTIALGKIDEDMCEKYTLVLKGHIALASAIFPEGTTGAQLDAIVRAKLWRAGMDYAHGTGHGVGFFLNVHEGPYGISPRSHMPILEGMLISNEPGFYKSGHYGIRLENLILTKKYKDEDAPGNMTGKTLLCFETVTKVRFEEPCIKRSMLTADEEEWLDNYHASCV